jgi:HK97 family phage prohead protease
VKLIRRADVCIERKSGPMLEFKRNDTDRIECGLIELKFDEASDKEMLFEGYGAIFGNVDSYGDVIAKGAFRKSIKEAKSSGVWPAMLLQHGGWGLSADDMNPIGVWTDMEEDEKGLYLKGKLAPTARGSEVYTLLKMQPRPAITGLSIGYIPVRWKMGTKPDEPRRTLEEVRLMEISPVTFPANPKARIQSAKSQTGIRLAERALRDAGFSRHEAQVIVADGFKALASQCDADELGDVGAGLERLLSTISRPT